MAKKYLVTGGTGFIGSALVSALLDRGDEVRVLDNNWRGSRANLPHSRRLEIHEGDIRKPEDVAKATKGMDCVCHLAAINGTRHFYDHPDLVLEVAVKGVVNVVDACLTQGVGDLMVMSSSEVYQTPPVIPTPEEVPFCVPDPLNPRYSYGAGKIISEMVGLYCGRKLDRVLIVRPHNVYGPHMGWEHVIPEFLVRMKGLCREASKGKVRFSIQGSGEESRAYVFISDFIDGLMRVLDKGEHQSIYHIGTDEETTVTQLVTAVARQYGRQVEVVPGALAQGSTLRRCPDITKLKRLGYRPRVSLEEGIAKAAAWYDANPKPSSDSKRSAA